MTTDPGWMTFSLSTSPWVPFSADSEIHNAFATQDWALRSSDEETKRWAHRAETSIIHWIIHRIIGGENRSNLFRALGRGWIFIFINRNQNKFRWWFESVQRVLRNHQADLNTLRFNDALIEKYTSGYNCQCEVVFVLKGLIPTCPPLITIMKIADNFVDKAKWAPTAELQRSVASPYPTDAERHAHALRSQHRKAQKKRSKDRRKAKDNQAGSTTGAERTEDASALSPFSADGRAAMDDFEQMLAEAKAELGGFSGRPAVESAEPEGSDASDGG